MSNKKGQKAGRGERDDQITKENGQSEAQALRRRRELGELHRHGGRRRRRWRQGAGGQGGRVLELLHCAGTDHGQAGTEQHRRGSQNSQAPTRPLPRCLLAPSGCCQGEPFTSILSNLSCSFGISVALSQSGMGCWSTTPHIPRPHSSCGLGFTLKLGFTGIFLLRQCCGFERELDMLASNRWSAQSGGCVMNQDAGFLKWCNLRSCIEFEFTLRLGYAFPHGHCLLRQCFCSERELDVFVLIVGIHKGEGDVRCEM